ncbi:hypothetical protein [Blastococcus tunisiensis]|uniref:Uncharacterized protein n=1 Tax=Blastococcus tunisiensis TaxID=1798228 RepID=A0A1I2BHP5_9ACTN|nr:hypothetical protein [Blastococcus sp. DSM 46838]SFE55589.1 hypothetical protein SAMN05216574_104164 [Blastococcus sp. DSM 46838]
MSRPSPISDGPAAAARSALPETATAAFDRLAGALLASPSAPLGPLLRGQLPGTAGVRWLRQEGLPPTTRPTALTPAQWLSLHECWSATSRAPGPGTPRGRRGGRPSPTGHAPGAAAIPRWGQ